MVTIDELRQKIKEILKRDDIKYVIGYEKGSRGASPSFAFTPEDAEKLIFSPLCSQNLAVYPTLEEKLPLRKEEKEDKRKIGIVVKGCDSRAFAQIIQEKGLKREDVVLIGVPCTGVVDLKKIAAACGSVKDIQIRKEDDHFNIQVDGESHTFEKEDILCDACLTCEYPNPVIYDVIIGESVELSPRKDFPHIDKLEEKSLQERWKYWEKKFERCIRCYACRNACPLCYCKECMVENLSPQWVRRSINVSENTAWNIMRAFHLAGRCVGCGACERACPMDIPLMELNKKLEKDIKELFDYEAGTDEEKPLLVIFNPDDPEEFVL